MNQVHGIIKRFTIAFHSAVYIQVSIQFRCLVRTCHTVELAEQVCRFPNLLKNFLVLSLDLENISLFIKFNSYGVIPHRGRHFPNMQREFQSDLFGHVSFQAE